MPLLAVPTDDTLRDFSRSNVARDAYERTWKARGHEALNALDDMLVSISKHEFHSWYDAVHMGLTNKMQ